VAPDCQPLTRAFAQSLIKLGWQDFARGINIIKSNNVIGFLNENNIYFYFYSIVTAEIVIVN
jgi:hypothetical protein